MRIQQDSIAYISALKYIVKIIFEIVFIVFICYGTASACTYQDALNADWGNYNKEDVVRILNEDMTEESDLALNQKMSCLIGDMKGFYKDFNKVSNGIKYEALSAISAIETGHFKSNVCNYYNNVGGMRNSKGYMIFDTKKDGIKALANLLIEEYLNPNGQYYEGKTIIDVSQHYNQSTHWVVMYVKVRLDMERRIDGIEPRWDSRESNSRVIRLSEEFNKISNAFINQELSRYSKNCIGFVGTDNRIIKGIVTLYLGTNQLPQAVLPRKTRKKYKSAKEKSKKS